MGLFRKPLTTEESKRQARYEASKSRLMELHTKASLLFYIDEIQSTDTAPQILVGEQVRGEFHPGTTLDIYDCEGLPVGHMTVGSMEEREVKLSVFEKGIRSYCTPEEVWDGYAPGQFLAVIPHTSPV